MSLRLTRVLLALSLLLNCFVLAGFVWRSWIEPPHWQQRAGGGLGARGMSPLEALAQDLKLEDSQQQALRPVFEHYADARRDRYRDIQKVRDAMVGEVQKPDFDVAKIDALIEQMTRLRGEAQKENIRAIAEM